MSSILRLKRRAAGGAPGAPASLGTTEPAYNEQDNILYLGYGDNGSGVATTIIPIAGSGAYVNRTTDQVIDGVKTFSSSPVAPTPSGTDNSTKVATTAFVKSLLSQVSAGALTYKGTLDASAGSYPSTPSKGDYYIINVAGTISGHTYGVGDWATYDGSAWDYIDNQNKVSTVNGQAGAVVLNTDNIAEGTTNFYFTVSRVLNTVLTGLATATNSAISATDSILVALGKLQAQINSRLIASNNLSDLTNASAARGNLGLGTMATQSSSAVSITGGSIDGVGITNSTIDCGVF